tara:strand:- start:2270 stop:2839 length:570 start_codon:yes stop_codon:yes gene_type:complete
MSKKQYNTTNEQLHKIEKKYGRLIYTIAHKIGGDSVVNSFEDSVQELYISALDACEAYERKTQILFDEFFAMEEFDKYIKSVLWNKKNNQGAQISKKLGVTRHATLNEEIVEVDPALEYEVSDVSSMLAEVDGVCESGEELIKMIVSDHRLVKPNGSLNISKISRNMSMTKKEVNLLISQLKNVLGEYF